MSPEREAPPTTKGTRPTAPLPLFRPATSDAPEPGLIALRRLLLQRWPGRLFLGGLAVRLVLGLIDAAGGTDLVSGLLGTLARGREHCEYLALILDRMPRRTGRVGTGEAALPRRIVDRYLGARCAADRIEELLELTGRNQAS